MSPGQKLVELRGGMTGGDGFEGCLEAGVGLDAIHLRRLDQLMECTPSACCFPLYLVGSPRDLTALFRRRISWDDGTIGEGARSAEPARSLTGGHVHIRIAWRCGGRRRSLGVPFDERGVGPRGGTTPPGLGRLQLRYETGHPGEGCVRWLTTIGFSGGRKVSRHPRSPTTVRERCATSQGPGRTWDGAAARGAAAQRLQRAADSSAGCACRSRVECMFGCSVLVTPVAAGASSPGERRAEL